MGGNVQPDLIAVVAYLGVKTALVVLPRFGQRHYGDERLLPIAFDQGSPHFIPVNPRRQQGGRQGNLHPHSAAKGADRRHKLRLPGNPGIPHHLRDMLVPLIEAIGGGIGQIGQFVSRVFPLFNEGLAAAGVAGKGVDGQGGIGGQQPGVNQGAGQQDEPGGVAARIGDIFGAANGRPLPRMQFRQSVFPTGGDPMGGAGVNQPGSGIGNPPGRRCCGVIRQAKNGDLRFQEAGLPFLGIAPQFRGQGQQFQIRPPGQPLVDPQAGGSGMAVNKHFRQHKRSILILLFGNCTALV